MCKKVKMEMNQARPVRHQESEAQPQAGKSRACNSASPPQKAAINQEEEDKCRAAVDYGAQANEDTDSPWL